MARRTYAPNALEPVLSSGITGGSTSIPLDSVSGLTVPGYMVIDPDKIAKREYFKFESINGSSLETLTRGLAGSAGGAQAHDAGATVRSVLTSQALDDIFLDIIDLEADQHTKYLDSEVDAIVAVHDAIVDAHHAKYTDTEAAAKIALDDLYVPRAEGIDAVWTDYTPTWGGGSPDIGNGILAGRYIQLGDMVTAVGFLQPGSTTDFGSGGIYYLGLPVTRAAQNDAREGFDFTQGARINDDTDGLMYMMVSEFATTTQITLVQNIDGGAATFWTLTNPITLGESDRVHWMLTYEAA